MMNATIRATITRTVTRGPVRGRRRAPYQRGRLDTLGGLCRVVLVGLLDRGTPGCSGVGHAPGGVLVGGFQSAQGALEAGHHVTRQQLVAVAGLLPRGGPLVDPGQEPA